MAQVSSNVVWDIVRRESSFLRKVCSVSSFLHRCFALFAAVLPGLFLSLNPPPFPGFLSPTQSKNIQLCAERLNVRNVNSYKYSGFAQPSVSVTTKASDTAGYNGKVQLVRSTKKQTSPAKAVSTTNLAGGVKRASRRISKNTSATYYRPDLKRDVCAKYSALVRSMKNTTPSLPKKTVRPRA